MLYIQALLDWNVPGKVKLRIIENAYLSPAKVIQRYGLQARALNQSS